MTLSNFLCKLTLLSFLLSICQVSIAKTATPSSCGTHISPDTTKTKYFPLVFKLPNDEWNLAVYDAPSHYIFKRNPIIDSAGRQIIPAIAFYSEDAKWYKQDIAIFCSKKMQPFLDRGVKVDRIFSWNDKEFPLTFKNALFMKGTYTQGGIDHIIYMIYILDKYDKGIQVYLDMTKEVAVKYESEFWITIKSLKETP